MITDKLKNISIYNKIIPIEALDFIESLDCGTTISKYTLSDKVYANIETYNTKQALNGKFESHNNYIDIQILLSGEEYIYYRSIEGLKILEKYNEQKDITFYSNDIVDSEKVKLDGTNFMLIYPHEAHAPQISVSDSDKKVLKVVIKVKV